jgi:hypothetical protein
VSDEFVEKEERRQKGGYEFDMEQNSKYAARATQIDRQVEKKTYSHDTDS